MAYNVKNFQQYMFYPKYPSKVVSDVNKLKAKSSWEFEFFKRMDETDAIIRWGYETIKIPYIKPTDYREHKYELDIVAEAIEDGRRRIFFFEIKPKKFTQYPKKPKTMTEGSKRHSNYLAHCQEVEINIAKFNAATEYARSQSTRNLPVTFIVVCFDIDKKTKKVNFEQIVWNSLK